MNTVTPIQSIVPAFFVVEAGADRAAEVAADGAMFLNDCLNAPDNPAGAPARLFLCEASPTTEMDLNTPVPRTLEGLTCDSGSDRSAAGLIRAIADHARAVEGGTPAELTASVVAAFGRIQQLAEGWLLQRMALHPTAPPIQPAEAKDLLELIFQIDPSVDPQPGSIGHRLRTALANASPETVGER